MKNFKSILCAALLTLAMTSATFAGNIYGRTGNIYGVAAPASTPGNIYGLTDELITAGVGVLTAVLP
jgi:hypothetical protein